VKRRCGDIWLAALIMPTADRKAATCRRLTHRERTRADRPPGEAKLGARRMSAIERHRAA
jgi:hypothetical protein